MSRQLQRSILKTKYAAFCKAWHDEKLFQRITLESGRPLPAGVNSLGRKPTFRMWAQAMKNQELAALQVMPEKAVEVKDTEWED
jgi:hypothetical protein